MRILALLLLLCVPVAAQGMPPAKRTDSWKSPHNQKRLRFAWEMLPSFKPTKLPDGTEEPPRAPWPFVVYVHQTPSKGSAKLDQNVLEDTRWVLACHAVKAIQIKPHKAVDVPYLASVQGIRDPTLIVVDRDFNVVGVIKSTKEFTAKKVLPLLVKGADSAYKGKLNAYIAKFFKLLQEGDRLWALETKMEKLRSKAAAATRKRGQKFDKEADEIEKLLEVERAALEEKFIALEDSLLLKGEKKEAIETTIGSGKKKRKLTPQEIEAIETYREFSRDKNPIVRAAAVEDMGVIDSVVMVHWILKAANDTDFLVVEAAGKALGRMKSAESLEAIAAGLVSGNAKAKMACVLAFAAISRPYPAAIPAIKKFIKHPNDEMRRAAIKALEHQSDPAASAALVTALSDRLPALRVMAATALGTIRAESAGPALIELIDRSDWSLRKAAVESLAKIRVKPSIGPLLAAFEKEKGLMEEVLYKALVAITGQDFRYKRENWRKWWDRWGNGFKVPTDAEIAVAKKKREEALKGYYDPNKRRYHKIETLSRKMIFVIDISASMKDKIIIPPYAPQKVRDEFPDRVKMEIAKKELIELLATLEPNIYFNIITFAGRVKSWKDGLVSGSSRTSAIKYVAKLKAIEAPRGKKAGSGEEQKTNTYGALMAAFGLQDSAVPNWKARTKVDTIFIVTDGVAASRSTSSCSAGRKPRNSAPSPSATAASA